MEIHEMKSRSVHMLTARLISLFADRLGGRKAEAEGRGQDRAREAAHLFPARILERLGPCRSLGLLLLYL